MTNDEIWLYKKAQEGGGGGFPLENYLINPLPCLINGYLVAFSNTAGDIGTCGGRGGQRASSEPAFWFNCRASESYYGYAVAGLSEEAVELTATTQYGGGQLYTQTTTNGNTVYIYRLGAMIGGPSTAYISNSGSHIIEIPSNRYIDQDGTTFIFDQIFIDSIYDALVEME